MTLRRRLTTALAVLAASGFLIGAAGQLAKMVVPDSAAQNQARLSDVAPILIGGFLIGAAAQSAEEAPEQSSGRVVLS
ncbi:hypothetical protein [Streptomyces yaizuensis]|uniref:Uncharacterized protein n=1 Tax=Streptomyces yaizuensis TaxID=2989713 RepID=A0ABQ5NZ59_9ACTN|nr:hypothetical protein [Streptomyces sp. YSPA8]GLF95644.1 hypothetical protein SYYSPA8_15125 [Streptomyces sp. YSPA8]